MNNKVAQLPMTEDEKRTTLYNLRTFERRVQRLEGEPTLDGQRLALAMAIKGSICYLLDGGELPKGLMEELLKDFHERIGLLEDVKQQIKEALAEVPPERDTEVDNLIEADANFPPDSEPPSTLRSSK